MGLGMSLREGSCPPMMLRLQTSTRLASSDQLTTSLRAAASELIMFLTFIAPCRTCTSKIRYHEIFSILVTSYATSSYEVLISFVSLSP